jgi:hypothetical protein
MLWSVTAELPELWTERTPEQGHLFGRAPTFGVAGEAERAPQEAPPAPLPEDGRKPPRERGPFVTYLSLPWSYGDRSTWDRWHRLRCRCGRHELRGGDTMQLGGTVVFIERRCRWCGRGADEVGARRG